MKALAVLFLTSACLLAAETNQLPDRPGMLIKAEFAEFRLKDGIYFYSNNVTVTDPPAKPGGPPTILRCRELTAKQTPGGNFESIVALHSVEIDQGQDRARGNRAVYTRSNEWMVLTGPFDPADTNYPRPYLLRAYDTIHADKIIYDRLNDRLQFQRPDTVISSNTLSRGRTNAAATNKSPSSKPQSPFTK